MDKFDDQDIKLIEERLKEGWTIIKLSDYFHMSQQAMRSRYNTLKKNGKITFEIPKASHPYRMKPKKLIRGKSMADFYKEKKIDIKGYQAAQIWGGAIKKK